MRKKTSNILWGFSLILISIFILSTSKTQTVYADLTDTTDKNVLQDAPDGIDISSYMSNTAPTVTAPHDIYTTNSGQIVDHSGKSTGSGNIISLANDHNTYGSMWSTNKTFDINKEQTISAWLYFGNGDGDTDAINSEGIAFVLQNDSKGIGALGAGLEGMGVYGYDASNYNALNAVGASQSYIQKTAIQNSVALEFDSSLNSFYKNKPINNSGQKFGFFSTGYYSLDGYDTPVGTSTSMTNTIANLGLPSNSRYGAKGTYGHIALAYPGYADSYQSIDISGQSSSYSPFSDGFVLIHVDPQTATLLDATDTDGSSIYWHHVTIKWHPAASDSTTGHLEYIFNDIRKDGSENTNTTLGDFTKQTDTIPVDTTKLATTDGKVRWGFTAANGPSTDVATKLVALDSIPDLLYADASANIVDTTLSNKTITSSSTDKTVASGDSLKLNYALNYQHGNVSWQNIATKIKIPDNVTTQTDTSGNIGYITYGDSAKTTEGFTADELNSGYLAHTLAKNLGTQDDAIATTASITINAKANSVTSDTKVAAAAAIFTGSNEITTTSTPAFTIKAPASYTLKLANTNSSSDLNLLYKSDNATLNLPTELTYSDSHSFGDSTTGTNIIYQVTAGGKTYTVGSDASGTAFDQTIDLKSLINDDDAFWKLFTVDSTNQVTVKAIDQANGLVSNTITYNVKTMANKSLSMTVSNNLKFKDINYSDATQYLTRKNDFDLSVTSLREPWRLNVTTNGLYLDGKTLNSNMALVYRKNSSADYQTLSSTPTTIDQDNTSHETSYTDDISDNWKTHTGLLLEQLGTSQAGQYTGTLTWEVSDVLNNG